MTRKCNSWRVLRFICHPPFCFSGCGVCMCVRVCFARKTSNYFRMQISGFSADFFCAAVPHGSRQTPFEGKRGQMGGERSGKGTETDSWSAPNLSQWYADKTNKYQRFFFIPFGLSSCSFFIPPSLLRCTSPEEKSWETTLANKFI